MDLHGIINFHKQPGITSAKALYAVRKVVGQRKSGHAGTLDPAADGVLVLCLGRATKLVERVMDQPKVYRARARLDVTSESFDSDRPLIDVPVATPPDEAAVRAALDRFVGEIEQVPPAVSAIKVGGQASYKLERRGQAAPLKARPARIYWNHLHSYEWPELDFEMACGRGTYVRALIRDLGATLGTGGCLTALTRTSVGPFHIDKAWTLDALRAAVVSDEYLIDLDHAGRWLAAEMTIPEPPGEHQPADR
ncbi:MAG: tRNA pseudouridine(55) synthase TruB [bacterium]|nr:tRNA pseudouridine(55) synthase TruB [bacterium]